MTDWKNIAINLRNALMATEKWWEHKELLKQVDDLILGEQEKTSIKELRLCVRIENALLRSGCSTIEQLHELRDDQILSIRGLGDGSIPPIRSSIARWFKHFHSAH